jgi:hypothetical protein
MVYLSSSAGRLALPCPAEQKQGKGRANVICERIVIKQASHYGIVVFENIRMIKIHHAGPCSVSTRPRIYGLLVYPQAFEWVY